MRAAAPSPCTGTGQSRMLRGNRRAMVVRMSCSTAPCSEVMTPTSRGSIGSGRFRAVANSPSSVSRARSISIRASSAPAPAYSIRSTMSW